MSAIPCLWCGRLFKREPGGTEDRPQVCGEKCLRAWDRAASKEQTQ